MSSPRRFSGRRRALCCTAIAANFLTGVLLGRDRVGHNLLGGAQQELGFVGDFNAISGTARTSRQEKFLTQRSAVAQGQKLWTLSIRASDHYVWNDEAVFTGILADAGEWELQVDVIQDAFKKAKLEGSADVFSAPLYVIRDYVQELQNYGLAAEAIPTAERVGADEGELPWKQKDWKELSPDVKESLGPGREVAEAASEGPKASVVVYRSDHPSLAGGKTATARFRAYVEMGADAAGRFCPDEGSLNACFNRILGPVGKSEVLTDFTPGQAEKAAEQLRLAGFIVEVKTAQAAAQPTRAGPTATVGVASPAPSVAGSVTSGVRDFLLGK